jgi:hypothetical protein
MEVGFEGDGDVCEGSVAWGRPIVCDVVGICFGILIILAQLFES